MAVNDTEKLESPIVSGPGYCYLVSNLRVMPNVALILAWELVLAIETTNGTIIQFTMASNTATASQLPDICNEIEALLSWNPPHLISVATKKKLSSAWPPSFYDKHFSKDLVLQQVEHLLSLVPALTNNVDIALHTALATLSPPNGFITAQR